MFMKSSVSLVIYDSPAMFVVRGLEIFTVLRTVGQDITPIIWSKLTERCPGRSGSKHQMRSTVTKVRS